MIFDGCINHFAMMIRRRNICVNCKTRQFQRTNLYYSSLKLDSMGNLLLT